MSLQLGEIVTLQGLSGKPYLEESILRQGEPANWRTTSIRAAETAQ